MKRQLQEFLFLTNSNLRKVQQYKYIYTCIHNTYKVFSQGEKGEWTERKDWAEKIKCVESKDVVYVTDADDDDDNFHFNLLLK